MPTTPVYQVKLVTPKTIDFITAVRGGERPTPDQEHDTFFVYESHNFSYTCLMTRETFYAEWHLTHIHGDNCNCVIRI
jgi:hypothetical protein